MEHRPDFKPYFLVAIKNTENENKLCINSSVDSLMKKDTLIGNVDVLIRNAKLCLIVEIEFAKNRSRTTTKLGNRLGWATGKFRVQIVQYSMNK